MCNNENNQICEIRSFLHVGDKTCTLLMWPIEGLQNVLKNSMALLNLQLLMHIETQ
jgi:hypothetical protein